MDIASVIKAKQELLIRNRLAKKKLNTEQLKEHIKQVYGFTRSTLLGYIGGKKLKETTMFLLKNFVDTMNKDRDGESLKY